MAKLLSNFRKDIQAKWNLLFENKYKSLGFTWSDVKKTRSIDDTSVSKQKFLSCNLYFQNGHEVMHGIDEIFLDELYKAYLPENAYIIDCGAHIGLSVIYLKTHCPTAQVIAFEPDDQNFNLLQKNITSFGFSNVELKKEAVWKENTMLHFAQEGSMSSKIDTSLTHKESAVRAVRLKDYIHKKVDFLKIDIEGAEYEVIKDIQSQLHFIENFFIEYHGSFSENYRLNEILQILTNANFKYYIREATPVYRTPFSRDQNKYPYDVQLNIFCFR